MIVDPANIPTLGKFDDTEFEVLLYEFKADLNKYLAWLGPASPVHSLKDVIAFNDAHKEQEMPYFGQEIMVMAEKKGPLTSVAYKAALAKNQRMARDARHRRGDDEIQARRARRADRRSGVADRPRQRRRRHRSAAGAVDSHVGRRLPAHHGARRATSTGCRSGFRSSAAPGASRRSSSSPTRTSRRPNIDVRRRSHRHPIWAGDHNFAGTSLSNGTWRPFQRPASLCNGVNPTHSAD